MKKSLFLALLACATLFVGCKETPVNSGGSSEAWTVKIDATELYLEKGTTHKLTAVVTPSSSKKIQWTSDNPEIATVDASGIVTAVNFGTAVITATIDASDVTPATCVINVTNDAVLNNFKLGGYAVFGLGNTIPGTDTVLEISVGAVKCQLAPANYYVWDDGIVLVNRKLSGAGYLLPLVCNVWVITEGAYAGAYIGVGGLAVDTISADSVYAYTAQAGQLVDVDMYGDAWDGIFTATEETTDEEWDLISENYYGSQTGTQFVHIDFNTSSQSYNCGNVSHLILEENYETGELYYDLKLEWYDHVNERRYYGLLVDTELNPEDGLEYITGVVKPYDMRVIHKQYLNLPPVEDEEEPAEVMPAEIKKPIRLDAKQAELLKSTVRMYKK